ncbi:MAG TPA: transglycosylase SLT domain-containing protein, partial [Chloroflexota bacterium]
LWSISIIYNPSGGGVYWLAAQSHPEIASHAPMPHGFVPGVTSIPLDASAVVPMPIVRPGAVTDVQRYQLARGAGFSPTDAITATAISIAEDGSGDPAAMSPANRNRTYDLGLWQINSSHWLEFGGPTALIDPSNNARAAYAIFARAGWCSWSTYLTSCGAGYTGAFAAFVGRARVAAGHRED